MKIKTGDTVLVLTGKDKGRTGKVERIYKKSDKVLVENINMHKKSIPKTEQYPKGAVIDVSRPVHISNIMTVDPKTKKPGRAFFTVIDGKKERAFKVSKRKKI